MLVDDLITRGVSEPYRMFTSRAEYRLSLREDNADLRLTEVGYRLGVVDESRWSTFVRKRDQVEHEMERLRTTWVNPRLLTPAQIEEVVGGVLEKEYTLQDLLRRPCVEYRSLMTLPGAGPGVDEEQACEQVQIQTKYEGYVYRQRAEVARRQAHEATRLPPDLDYQSVRGLSFEVQQKLSKHRPETVGQATRISGVTPAAISLLLVHLKRKFMASASGLGSDPQPFTTRRQSALPE